MQAEDEGLLERLQRQNVIAVGQVLLTWYQYGLGILTVRGTIRIDRADARIRLPKHEPLARETGPKEIQADFRLQHEHWPGRRSWNPREKAVT
jgi:hypothetical protein